MNYFGMLMLGIFVGSIITHAIRSIKDWKSLPTILTALFTTTFGGTVFVFIEFLGGKTVGEALYMYPMGLVLGMIWINIKTAQENIKSDNPKGRFLGWLNILGAILLSLLILTLLFSKWARSLLPQLPQ